MIDVLVVGSGPGGVHVATPLVAAGLRVVLLDHGNRDTRYAPLIPERPWSELRRTDPQQRRYFLGDRFEGIPFGAVRVGAQLTPPRLHVMAEAAARIPLESPGFAAQPSLAQGGLGAAWSAGVFPFGEGELRDMGLSLDALRPHYDAVAERIGVSAGDDDLAPFFPRSPSQLPPLELDASAERLLARYQGRRQAFTRRGFFLGRTPLAVSTVSHRGRGPEAYLDLAYWADCGRSIYRPQWTLEELQGAPHFEYRDRRFVEGFREEADAVTVRTRHADSGEEERWRARALVLAAGTLGSAWLVLRSLGRHAQPLPILCNPYTYVPTLHLGAIGQPARDRRHSLAQLTAMLALDDCAPRLVQSQVFSYRSLLTFKLMKETPLGHRHALRALRALIPALLVLGINHEDRPGPGKTITLVGGDGGERLRIAYAPEAAEERRQRADEVRVLRAFAALGCLPLRRVRAGHGASLHYAGTFPMRPEGGALTCDGEGRLRATRAVYLADGSVFPWIPPKGLTFNIMAQADRVGTRLARRLRGASP